MNGEEIRIAFESPIPRGFDDRARAIESAKAHIRTQFARLGVADPDVEVEQLDAVEEVSP